MAKIAGKNVVTEISTDGTTWKVLICETDGGFDFSRETSTAPRTKCDGAASGQNITPQGYTWSMNFEAMVDDAPTTAQVTYAEVQGYALNATLLHVRQQDKATAPDVYQKGTAYITELSSQHPEGDFVTFSGTFSGTGDVDFTAA